MARSPIVDRWILLALAGVCGASVAAWLAPAGWPFELFSHFRPQLAVAASLLVPAELWLGRRGAAVIAAAVAVVNLTVAAPLLPKPASAPSCSGVPLAIVTANVEFSNRDPRRFLEWLAAHPADIVVVQEVTPAWAATLRALPAYPYQRVLTREDPYGLAVVSHWPLQSMQPADLAGDGVPSLEGTVRVRGQSIHLLGLHTFWPITPALLRNRDLALLRAATHAREGTLPTVAAGDLNVTPDAPAFARLLKAANLEDAFAGLGWQPTWMAGFWPLALRIDHVLVSPSLCVEHAEVGPDVGSDHRPLLARLRLRPS